MRLLKVIMFNPPFIQRKSAWNVIPLRVGNWCAPFQKMLRTILNFLRIKKNFLRTIFLFCAPHDRPKTILLIISD